MSGVRTHRRAARAAAERAAMRATLGSPRIRKRVYGFRAGVQRLDMR